MRRRHSPLLKTCWPKKKGKEALGKIQQLLAQNPDDIVYNGYLAEIYRSEGENQKAKDVYKQLIETKSGESWYSNVIV